MLFCYFAFVLIYLSCFFVCHPYGSKSFFLFPYCFVVVFFVFVKNTLKMHNLANHACNIKIFLKHIFFLYSFVILL